jgi:hypothetical protein
VVDVAVSLDVAIGQRIVMVVDRQQQDAAVVPRARKRDGSGTRGAQALTCSAE